MTERFDDYTLEKECEQLAENILSEYLLDNDMATELVDEYADELSDRVTETVDGHEYVIYHYKALRFCAECNTDDGDAFLSEVGIDREDLSLSRIASTVLYGEMQARVTRHLTSLVEEHNADIEE
jgi:hypothetical protein